MNNFQRVFKNTSFLTISSIFIKAIGFLFFVYLARNLSVGIFGRYNLIDSVISLFSFLPDLGVGLVVVREIAKKTHPTELLLGNSLFFMSVMSAVTIIVIIIFAILTGFPKEVLSLLFISSLSLFLSQVRSVPLFYFEGIEKMEYTAILQALNSLFFTGFGFIGFVLGYGLTGIIVGFLVGTIISFVVTWGLFFAKKVEIQLEFDKDILKHLIVKGLPLGLAAFSLKF